MNNTFPLPIPPPEEADQLRFHRHKQLRQASWRGIIVRCLVIVLELWGVWIYGSAVLLVDTLGTAADVATTLALLACISLAARPPDEDHPFGHGRYEPLAGLQLGILLVAIGCVLTYFQLHAIYTGHTAYTIDHTAWYIPLIAAVLLWWAGFSMQRTAKEQGSSALAAEATHLYVDGWNSGFAALVLLSSSWLSTYSGLLDVVGALIIAIGMIVAGALAARENIHQIMDRTPEPALFQKVHTAARSVAGVKDTEKVRIMRYGPDAHVDIDVEVDPAMRVDDAHAISQHVRRAIQRDWPQVRDVTVHIEPFYPGDH